MLLVSPTGRMLLPAVGMVGGWRGCICPWKNAHARTNYRIPAAIALQAGKGVSCREMVPARLAKVGFIFACGRFQAWALQVGLVTPWDANRTPRTGSAGRTLTVGSLQQKSGCLWCRLVTGVGLQHCGEDGSGQSQCLRHAGSGAGTTQGWSHITASPPLRAVGSGPGRLGGSAQLPSCPPSALPWSGSRRAEQHRWQRHCGLVREAAEIESRALGCCHFTAPSSWYGVALTTAKGLLLPVGC